MEMKSVVCAECSRAGKVSADSAMWACIHCTRVRPVELIQDGETDEPEPESAGVVEGEA